MKFLKGLLHSDDIPKNPKTVILESTNMCNLRCIMCHVWGEGVRKRRETGFIPEAIWKKAVDELSTWDESINLALHGAGEALLHKDFSRILNYATAKKNLSVGFLTNGSLLTGELAKAILDSDIAWIGFSVDGAEQDKYKQYRGTDLKKVEANIEDLLALKKGNRPSTFVNMVALPDLDIKKFINRWIDKVDEVKISTYRPIGHRDFLTEKIERIPCYLLNEMLVITWNGKAVLCCEDIWAENIVGRFPEQSLHRIWLSRTLNKIRRLHNRGDMRSIPLCINCDVWSNKFTEVEIRENLKVVKSASQISYSRLKS